MSRNPERDAIQAEQTRGRILDAAYGAFSERSIESVTMAEVARAAGVGVATVYRYYPTKPDLAAAVSARVWRAYSGEAMRDASRLSDTAAEDFAYFLERFLDMYANHRDLLRFNHLFNAYVLREGVAPERMRPFLDVIDALAVRFRFVWEKGRADGTLRGDVPWQEMFSTTLHLMLAAATRYAVGLVYDGGSDPAGELRLLKDMLMKEYTR